MEPKRCEPIARQPELDDEERRLAREPIARQPELDDEERRLSDEPKFRRQAELEKRKRETANLHRPVDKPWGSRSGVDASQVVTYGIGRQYVYCYTFPSFLELAELKKRPSFKIKVGLASNDPIERIQQQISASKTAMSEPAKVLLVF